MKSLLSRRLKGEGTFVGMKGKMSFVDDSVGIEELMHRATTDSLSGLLNRATMERSIAQRLSSMEDDESCAVFIIDLDDFKRVNDILGHQAGDSALVMSARTISRLFRASDIAGRLGGDEFSVFICGKDVDRAFVEDKGQALCEALQLSLGENGIVGLTASVGICLSRHAQPFEHLYSKADQALYRAKREGKHTFRIETIGEENDRSDDEGCSVSVLPLETLLGHIDGGVAQLELAEEARIIYANDGFMRMLGEHSVAVPFPLSTIMHPDDLDALVDDIRTATLSHESCQRTCRVKGDGGWMWWRIGAVSIDQGGRNPLVLLSAGDVTSYKDHERRLESINGLLSLALDQAALTLWIVDIPSRRLYIYRKGDDAEGHEISYDDFPSCLVDNGALAPDSVKDFQRFASRLLGGQEQGSGNFMVRLPGRDHFTWVAISYRSVYDEVGHALRAVGIMQLLSQGFDGQAFEWIVPRLFPQALLSQLAVHIHINLTRSMVEEYWRDGGSQLKSIEVDRPDALLGALDERLSKESGEESIYSGGVADFLRRYEAGGCWLTQLVSTSDDGGNITAFGHIVHLTKASFSKDIYLNDYILRLPLPTPVVKVLFSMKSKGDGSLLDPEGMKKLSDVVFSTQLDMDKAVALTVVDGLAGLGQEDRSRLLRDMASSLCLAMGGGCLASLHGDDSLAVIFPSIESKKRLRTRLEGAISFIRRILQHDERSADMRIVVGVALDQDRSSTFDQLLERAGYACSQRWNSAVDTVVFASDIEDRSSTRLENGGSEDRLAMLTTSASLPMDSEDKDFLCDCLTGMLSAESLEDSIFAVLKAFGEHLNADRVYILMLSNDKRIVTMPYEWDDPCKRPLQQVTSGMALAKFPTLSRCLESGSPVFLSRKQEAGGELWRYMAFTLLRKDGRQGFLCIENPRRRYDRTAVFDTLIPYIINERSRFKLRQNRDDGGEGTLSSMPDLRSYIATVHTLGSGKYSSLGVVCVDIPAMTAINGSRGFEYGGRMLRNVFQTLCDTFGTSLLFRTWDAEFIAFCPDTTKSSFLSRRDRLRSSLAARYPNDVRIGSAWAGGKSFTGSSLVDMAKREMRPAGGHSSSMLSSIEGIWDFGDAFRFSSLAVHFQPIVDLDDGSLVGAEALVRGVCEDGTIVPPSQFIARLEESGLVRRLDLYVLSQVLDQVETWRRSGLGLVPVSVNFSRITLAHPSILASTIAIKSRYPQIPPSILSLEVTEEADVLSEEEFGDIVDSFRSYGFKLSLDDFGSHYANLSLFTNVTFDTVKLDKSLIAHLESNEAARMLVRDLVDIGSRRGMKCVAEGVEDEEQRRTLLSIGCHLAQGYYYGRPMSAYDFARKYLGGAKAEDL